MMSRFAALFPLVLSASTASAAVFSNSPRCGDCWCITDADDGNTCPTDTTGITDSFSVADEIYSTFELGNDPDFLKLRSASGGPCYPFADAFGSVPLDNYPESAADQCVSPEDDDDMVCAYVYDSSSTTCEGRKYRIQNFPSENDAMGSNAAILHKGACGVCSTAQDFGARIKTYTNLDAETIKCATKYTFSRDFPELISCFEVLGFTTSCSTLWAHFAATNGNKCAFDCIGVTEFNGPAPQCEPVKCMTCQEDFRDDFDSIAGIEFPKAGITERIAHDCDDFYRVIHDPCIGLKGISGDDSSPMVTDPGDEVAGSAPETTGDDMGSSGNCIETNLFATVVTLILSMIGIVLVAI